MGSYKTLIYSLQASYFIFSFCIKNKKPQSQNKGYEAYKGKYILSYLMQESVPEYCFSPSVHRYIIKPWISFN